jgi:hypothetical protein
MPREPDPEEQGGEQQNSQQREHWKPPFASFSQV